MADTDTRYSWWGIIAAVAIVVGSGLYSKGSVEPNDYLKVASNATANEDQTSQ